MELNNYFSCHFEDSLPIIRRARGFYLYDFSGNRYLDLFLSRGSAVLGHRCTGYSLVMKNSIDQSMYMSYPNIWHHKLFCECVRIFDGYSVRFFIRNPYSDYKWVEPWETWESSSKVVLSAFWRPSLLAPKAQSLVLVLPVPFHPVWIVLTPSENKTTDLRVFPKSSQVEIVPAVFARLLLKALANWKLAQSFEPMSGKWRGLFSRFCTVHGRYFFSNLSEEKHKQWFMYACESGFFIPPKPHMLGFLPTLMSKGEQNKLQMVLQWDFKKRA